MITRKQIKFVKSLHQKKYRYLHRCFIVESSKNVLEIINSNYEVKLLFATKKWLKSNKILINEGVLLVTDNDLKRVTCLKNPSDVLAVVKIPDTTNNFNFSGINVALDSINDPGNFGTILRTCDWFGIKNIYCSKNCVDLFNPKVVQSSMGSISRVNVFYTDLFTMINKLNKKVYTYAAVLDGKNLNNSKLNPNSLLIFGNESKGISDDILDLVNYKVTISKKGLSDSLNVSVSVGIILNKFCS